MTAEPLPEWFIPPTRGWRNEDSALTSYRPETVLLTGEVVPEDSQVRDRIVEPERYAEAGIPDFWRVEDESFRPVVHVYGLDVTTRSYVPTAIVRERTELRVPFPLVLATLLP